MNLLVVCGAGMGTSVIMKIKLTQFLEKNKIQATVESCGLDEGKGSLNGYDIVICSTHLAEELGKVPEGTELIAVGNIMAIEQEYGDQILELIKAKQG